MTPGESGETMAEYISKLPSWLLVSQHDDCGEEPLGEENTRLCLCILEGVRKPSKTGNTRREFTTVTQIIDIDREQGKKMDIRRSSITA
jgi:hypothetical protein